MVTGNMVLICIRSSDESSRSRGVGYVRSQGDVVLFFVDAWKLKRSPKFDEIFQTNKGRELAGRGGSGGCGWKKSVSVDRSLVNFEGCVSDPRSADTSFFVFREPAVCSKR